MLGNQMGINKTPSRNLVLWWKMPKHKAPVDPFTLRQDYSLQKPSAGWQLDPNKWGSALSTRPIYLLGMLRYVQGLKVTDPRGRVKTSLNLVADYKDDGYSPGGYECTLVERYCGVAWVLPWKCNSLQFLPQAKLLEDLDEIVKWLPSWAPNETYPAMQAPLSYSSHRRASPHVFVSFQGVHDGIFHARGFEVKETLL